MWAAALGAVAAIFRAVGEALRVWQLRQAKQAGRVEAERDVLRSERRTGRRAAEIDSEIRRLDDAGLTEELRTKWTRD